MKKVINNDKSVTITFNNREYDLVRCCLSSLMKKNGIEGKLTIKKFLKKVDLWSIFCRLHSEEALFATGKDMIEATIEFLGDAVEVHETEKMDA